MIPDRTTDPYQACMKGTCPHVQVTKCPWCNVKWWTDAVFDFSHGRRTCGCGYTVTPELVPATKK